MKTRLKCTTGWVEIERIIDGGKEAIELTIEIEGEKYSAVVRYVSSEKADIDYHKMLEKNPDELKEFILTCPL